MSPVPLGDALKAGWESFKAQPVPILIGLLCAMLVGIIPVVGGFLAFPGLLYISLKAVRGQTPEAGDAFIAFQKPVDHIVMGLLQAVGVLACCIGVYTTQGLFFQGSLLIIDKGLGWSEAKDLCMGRLKESWVGWSVFAFVVGLVGGLGTILCIVGVFATIPIAFGAFAYAYEHGLAREA